MAKIRRAFFSNRNVVATNNEATRYTSFNHSVRERTEADSGPSIICAINRLLKSGPGVMEIMRLARTDLR